MKFKKLKDSGKQVFTAREANKLGISRQLLWHYLKKGWIEKVSKGVYRLPEARTIDFYSLLREICAVFPRGVVGFYTALRVHEVTEELPPDIDIIVPEGKFPTRRLKDVRIHRTKGTIYKRGVVEISGFPVTSIERTIIDLLRDGESISFILNILQEARAQNKQVSLSEIKRLSPLFRVKEKVKRLLEAWV